jgi:hypothetical protein
MSAAWRMGLLVMSSVMLCVTVWVWYGLQSMGFPDGHVTAFERAIRTPHQLLCGASVLLSLVGLGWGMLGKKISVQSLLLLGLGYTLLCVVPYLGSMYYYRHVLKLEHGEGGKRVCVRTMLLAGFRRLSGDLRRGSPARSRVRTLLGG